MKFLEWFIKETTQKKWAELGGYTCKAVLESADFRKATPYNEAFYRLDVHGQGLLGDAGICRTSRPAQQQRLPVFVGNEGTAKEALDGVAHDWKATFKKYGRYKSTSAKDWRGRAATASVHLCRR